LTIEGLKVLYNKVNFVERVEAYIKKMSSLRGKASR
jgi:hypothetical protein